MAVIAVSEEQERGEERQKLRQLAMSRQKRFVSQGTSWAD